MRLPRHDTPLRLPAETPREAIARDEALLDSVAEDGQPLVRWWVASSAAVVVGVGLRHRLADVVDLERCQQADIEVLERKAGGGALLLDAHMLCGAVCLPTAAVSSDLTESYRWLGDRLVGVLMAASAEGVRRVEVDEARADVAALRLRACDDEVARLLLATCYGALSPHEVVAGERSKLVGLAQVRRRHAALYQLGILLGDQSPLADFLRVPDEQTRELIRAELGTRTVGLDKLTCRSTFEVAAAIVGATSCVL